MNVPLGRGSLLAALWCAWALYWWMASRHAKATERRESILSRLMHLAPMSIAGAMLWAPRLGVAWLDARYIARTPTSFWIGTVITLVGLAFSVWARRHLGRNWSAIVTLKQGH
jgi:hypothetical protein